MRLCGSAPEHHCYLAVCGGQQVGFVAQAGGINRASLWSGTAASRVDLTPAAASSSLASGVWGSQQVGWANIGGTERASLWDGSAASWVDLGSFLDIRFTNSEARGIWSDGSFTYVVGFGHNGETDRDEAIMWVAPVPAPSGLLALGTGLAIVMQRRGRH
jgi:hypothetical protein